MKRAIAHTHGREPACVWHAETELPACDLVILPGGFSYGDYLRAGAIAARAPIMRAVAAHAAQGRLVLGVCNGFQILTECGLLPGALLRNRDLRFLCKWASLRVENATTAFTRAYKKGQVISFPIAHHDGNYFANENTLAELEGEGLVVLRYCDKAGHVGHETNINGSCANIAGIVNGKGNIMGLMPHPENAIAPYHTITDGTAIFAGLDHLGHRDVAPISTSAAPHVVC